MLLKKKMIRHIGVSSVETTSDGSLKPVGSFLHRSNLLGAPRKTSAAGQISLILTFASLELCDHCTYRRRVVAMLSVCLIETALSSTLFVHFNERFVLLIMPETT